MKRKLLCLFTALIVLNSCSSDYKEDETPANESVILLKKTIDKDSDGSVLTTTYTYNGNKIVSQVNNLKEGIYYTYTGDLITKMDFKLADGTIEQVNTYEYDAAGKLITFKRIDPIEDLGNKEVYSYNADGSISVVEYIGDSKTQTQKNATSKITVSNGEVIEIVPTNSPNHKYTHDTKNNPYKNVLGMGKIAFVDGEADGILHNILTDKSGNEIWSNYLNTYTYTYNSDNYLVTSTDTETSDDGTEKSSTEYFY